MTIEKKCPFCNSETVKHTAIQGISSTWEFDCSVCGKFISSHKFLRKFPSLKHPKIHQIRGAIREKNLKGITPEILTKETNEKNCFSIESLLESVFIPKTLSEKTDKFLLNLNTMTGEYYGEKFSVSYQKDYPLAFSKNDSEFNFILSAMKSQGLFADIYFAKDTAGYNFMLSADAWERIERLKGGNFKSKQGFVACWFADKHDKHREAIEKGITNAGFDPMAIKDKNYPETILSKALGEIRKSRFVVVDITEQRSTVFVEWGFAKGLGIQAILVIHKDYWKKVSKDEKKSLEFYAKNYNIKQYENEKELQEIVATAITERIGLPS